MKGLSTSALASCILLLSTSIAFALLIESNLSLLSTHFDTYLTVSVALTGGSLTFAGIVLTYYLGEESRLLASIRMYLRDCLSKLQSWRVHPSRSAPNLQSIYDKTEHIWSSRLNSTTPASILTLIMPFLPFVVLIVAIFGLVVFVNVGNTLWMFLASFCLYLAIALLFLELTVLVERLRNIQSIKTFSGSGKLWLSQINRKKYGEPLKEITYQVGRKKWLRAKLSFEGKIRNGFFHAVLIGDELRKPVSDPNTYFQENVYTRTLKVIVDPKFDIGVVQGTCEFENTYTEMKLDLRLDGVRVDGSPARELVRRIQIGIYEDPVDLPSGDLRGTKFTPTGLSVERHLIDQVIIELRYSGEQRAQGNINSFQEKERGNPMLILDSPTSGSPSYQYPTSSKPSSAPHAPQNNHQP